jgi:O-antigen ligase
VHNRDVIILLQRVLLLQSAVLPIAILPYSAMEPINTPQFAVLVFGAFCLAGLIATSWKRLFSRSNRPILIVLGMFNIAALLSVLNSKSYVFSQFYGGNGRHTGYLTYFSLTVILTTSVILSGNAFNERYLKVLIGSGSVATTYGIIQYLGLDPVPWNNIFSPVIGFLGNPNFQSAFLSITGVPIFAVIISNRGKRKRQFALFVLLVLLLFTIYQTDSRQGLLSFAAGMSAVIFIWLRTHGRKALTNFLGVLMVLSGFLVILGIFSYGPLGNLLYKRSNSARMYYWDAAWKMTLEHPFFGVGLDNYGQWYRRSRSVDSVQEFGIDSISDVAHNVFLEFSTSGGFLFAFSYVGICFLTLLSIIRTLRRGVVFNRSYSALVGAWFAFQIQSLVSINQLSLVFLGWTLSGLLIGYDYHKNSESELSEKRAKRIQQKAIEAKFVIVLFVTSSLGIFVGSQPMIASVKFRQAIESANLQEIYKAARYFPAEPIRIYQVTSILRENKLEKEALDTLEYGLSKFPENYLLWKKLSETEGLSESESLRVKGKLKFLEPNSQ